MKRLSARSLKFLVIGGITLILLLTFQRPSFADFESDYQNYLKTYDDYRTKQNAYLTTRNQYLTYGTLTSKNEALDAVRSFLLSRSDVLLGYFSLLGQKNFDVTYSPLLEADQQFVTLNRSQITSISSLEDAVKHSQKLEVRHEDMQLNSRKMVGSVIVANIQMVRSKYNLHIAEGLQLLSILRSQGKNVTPVERWLLEASKKDLLCDQKLTDASNMLTNLEASTLSDLTTKNSEIQFTLFEAHQYLREAISYVGEFKEAIKYGEF